MRQTVIDMLARMKKRSVLYIGGSDTLPPPLSKQEEIELMEQMKTNETAVRNTLIERNLRLVVYIARKFENTGIGIEDLISIGTIGLIKGISTFDMTKGARLATYAARCIENAIPTQRNPACGAGGVFQSVKRRNSLQN